jgi:hypothetical protein
MYINKSIVEQVFLKKCKNKQGKSLNKYSLTIILLGF